MKPTPRVFGFLFSLCLTEVFGLLPAPSVWGDLVSCYFLASYDHVIGDIYKAIKLRFAVLCNIDVSLSLKGSDDITGIFFWALTLHLFPQLSYFCANSTSATNIQVGSMRMSMKFELALLVTPPKNWLNGQPDTKQLKIWTEDVSTFYYLTVLAKFVCGS